MNRGKRTKKPGLVKARKTAKPQRQQNQPVAPPAPTKEPPAEFVAALAKLTEGLRTKGWRKDERAEELTLLTGPIPRKPRRQRTRAHVPLLLSGDQIVRGKARYNELLDKDQQRYRFQQASAKEITAFLKLRETSWQTVEDQIIVPVLYERHLKRQRAPKNKK